MSYICKKKKKNIKRVLTRIGDLKIDLRILLKRYVFRVLLHGVESWTMSKALCKKTKKKTRCLLIEGF